MERKQGAAEKGLKRTLSLPLLILYGLGVTIGAGIYVLLGVTADRAGVFAPTAFIVAAVAVFFSACSFAELSRRFPVAAGEAAYIRSGLNSRFLSVLVGILVVVTGIVSSAAIAIGSVGYIREFIDLPAVVLILSIVSVLGIIAAWGVTESVLFAGLFTVVEAGALLLIVAIAFWNEPQMIFEIRQVVPDISDTKGWSSVSSAALIAFFAFIGFEDIVNLAEESNNPERNLPLAIFTTLGLATIIYVFVSAIAVLTVPPAVLAGSDAPMSLIFERITGLSPWTISAIAIVATLNGIIIQIVMASRVLYGLARQGSLPSMIAYIHPRTRTPLVATCLTVGLILLLAMAFPLETLAETTSRFVLIVFLLVNAALLRLTLKEGSKRRIWLPGTGCASCAYLLIISLL